jgi:hypothetical protein
VRLRARAAPVVAAALVVAAFLAACAGGGTPAPAANTPLPGASVAASATPSQPAAVSSSGSPTAATAAPATAAPGASATPTTQAGDVAADPARKYTCAKLITEAEMKKATGQASAAFFRQELWTDTKGLPEGETYCQFFVDQGAVSIAVSVWTGPAFTQLQAAGKGATGSVELPGIGDRAIFSAATGFGAARVGGTYVVVAIRNTSGGAPAGIDVKGAVERILTVAAGRV